MSQDDLARAVSQLQLESGLSKSDFAKKLGVNAATVRRIVQKETTPEDWVLSRIATKCGRPALTLIRIRDEGGDLPPSGQDDGFRAGLENLAGRVDYLEGQIAEVRALVQELMRQDGRAVQEDPA